MGSLPLGLAAALAAAALYGCGPLIQAVAARRAPAGSGLGLGLLGTLARNKLWLAGVGADLGGFGFEAVALGLAPAAFVTPLLLFDMVVLALLAGRVVRERLPRAGLGGIGLLLAGGALMTVAFSGAAQVGRPARTGEQLGLAVVLGLACGAGLLAGRRRPSATTTVILAATSGTAYAIGTLCTRQLSLAMRSNDFWHVLLTPAPYVLTAAAVLSLALLSRALQVGAAVVAIPVMSAVAGLLPAIAGLLLFGEHVPAGRGLAAFVGALPLLVGGVWTLARQQSVGAVLEAEAAPAGAGHPLVTTGAA